MMRTTGGNRDSSLPDIFFSYLWKPHPVSSLLPCLPWASALGSLLSYFMKAAPQRQWWQSLTQLMLVCVVVGFQHTCIYQTGWLWCLCRSSKWTLPLVSFFAVTLRGILKHFFTLALSSSLYRHFSSLFLLTFKLDASFLSEHVPYQEHIASLSPSPDGQFNWASMFRPGTVEMLPSREVVAPTYSAGLHLMAKLPTVQ